MKKKKKKKRKIYFFVLLTRKALSNLVGSHFGFGNGWGKKKKKKDLNLYFSRDANACKPNTKLRDVNCVIVKVKNTKLFNAFCKREKAVTTTVIATVQKRNNPRVSLGTHNQRLRILSRGAKRVSNKIFKNFNNHTIESFVTNTLGEKHN